MKHDVLLYNVFNADELQDLKGKRVLVALSGGADSVALLRLLMAVGIDCGAAHCNFHLRGEESMRDEQFVRDLCQRLNVPLTVKDFDVAVHQQEHGGSVEMACRELRYAWFKHEREQQGYDLIAVAHHADDQVETFFLNLLRGTGLRGLAGMQRLNGHIWRPLLNVPRHDILNYLESLGQDYIIDSTNAENDYRRNRLRNIVLPVIRQHFPQASERILDTMINVADDHSLLISLACEILPDDRHIDIKQLLSLQEAPTLLYHRIRNMGFNRLQCTQAVDAARQGHAGRQFTANGHLLVVNRQTLDIEDIDQDAAEIEIPFDLTSGLASPVHITVSYGDAPFSPLMCDGKNKVAFNTSLLNCHHIVLRHWRKGDRFKPYGMKGSKLVSDLFADLKHDHAAKQNTWLLEADGDIIWVVGYRASAHYPIARESQEYLLMTLQ